VTKVVVGSLRVKPVKRNFSMLPHLLPSV